MKTDERIPTCAYYWGFPIRTTKCLPQFFHEEIQVPFEGYMLPVPKEYDKLLTADYGDYMTPPPEDKRNGGHFIHTLDLQHDYTDYIC